MNPVRWWRLHKKRSELEQLRMKYRELASIKGQTTVYTAEQMHKCFNRMMTVRAEIRLLEGKS